MATTLFELLGKIAIDNKDANKALQNTSHQGEKTASNLGSAFGKIDKGAIAVGKVVGAGMLAAGTAIGGLMVKSLNLAGELEQNMGGSEAVFKGFATKVQATAKDAFATMGLATSDYLATANKMGALFQGAGFTVEESMNLSADAMQRAADVASIMGIDTNAAMEAIAGAAKGNFTMMDNLGVAMNDTTLQAYALEQGITKSTQQMTNQEKIGLAMQMFMDKTAYAAGNYAKENETLAGSLSTAKAALTNFLDGSGDVDGLVSSLSNAANVIVENVSQIAPRLISGLSELLNQVVPMISPLLQQILPVLIEGAGNLITSLVAALPSVLSTIIDALPMVISAIQQIFTGLVGALPTLMTMLVSGLATLVPMLLEGVVSMIVTLCGMLPQIIQPLIDGLPTLLGNIVNAIVTNLPILIDGLVQLITGLVTMLPTLLPIIITGILQLVTGILSALPQIIAILITMIPVLIDAWVNTMISFVTTMADAYVTLFMAIVEALPVIITALVEAIPEIITSIVDALILWIPTLFETGKNLFLGLFEGMKALFAEIPSILKNLWDGIVGGFKALFGIHSPSTVMKELGGNIIQGLIDGCMALISKVTSVVTKIKDVLTKKFTEAKDKVGDIFDGIKDKIKDAIDKAKDLVDKGLAAIKGFFDKLKLKLPDIKLPHFKLEGKLSLNPPSVPKLSIDWYAKAMSNAMLLNSPTIFGYSPASGSLLGAGEAGEEVVAGSGTLMGMIRSAVQTETGATTALLERIADMLAEFCPNALAGMNQQLVLDTGVLVGQTASAMDAELGRLAMKKVRGR